MNTKIGRWGLAAMALGSMLVAPAFAEHGGGGHGGGAGGGGAHVSGGGGAHFGGGHVGGSPFSGAAHISSVGGGHSAGYRQYSGQYSGHYSGASAGYGRSTVQSIGAARGTAMASAAGHYAGRGSYGYPGGGHDWHGWRGGFWQGGYWGGGFWPGAFYGPGFAWFLPILPAAYGTYWWGGVPYYYANDVYYTWNPGYDGYVATDPPPVADAGGTPVEAAAPDADLQVFMYPKNGQSGEQQSLDRRECQQWAASQAGGEGANAADYRRAMVACVEGRGYSAK